MISPIVAKLAKAFNEVQYQYLVSAFNYHTIHDSPEELPKLYNAIFVYNGRGDWRKDRAIRNFQFHLLKFAHRMLSANEFQALTQQIKLDREKLYSLISGLDFRGITDATKETEREINMRKAAYTKWVNSGKMKKEQARKHFNDMKSAHRILSNLQSFLVEQGGEKELELK